ncbi:MAG: hypothetical protein E5V22_28295, partial [Mesorhizobium sp.]
MLHPPCDEPGRPAAALDHPDLGRLGAEVRLAAENCRADDKADDAGGARLAVEHFCRLGRRRIAHVT